MQNRHISVGLIYKTKLHDAITITAIFEMKLSMTVFCPFQILTGVFHFIVTALVCHYRTSLNYTLHTWWIHRRHTWRRYCLQLAAIHLNSAQDCIAICV